MQWVPIRFTTALIAFAILIEGERVSVAAESHIVVDAETGYVLLSKNAVTPRQVASLTKVATVLLALRWMDGEEVESTELMPVTSDAVSAGVNPLHLLPGDMISIESALWASMMASDNTSAYVLAEYIGSHIDSDKSGEEAVAVFVGQMNKLAEASGMEDTHFINPHGLDEAEAQGVSTAADMARLTIFAYRQPKFFQYSAEKEKDVVFYREGSPVVLRLTNTNELVGSRGFDGGKTGTTRRAGACLMASATESGENASARLISVVLDAEDRFRESVILMNEAWIVYEKWVAGGQQIGLNESLISGSK
tara:strand:+ start:5695 stop:6618 length:924 start_codon:yes stop_codon:yes gene_type:complete